MMSMVQNVHRLHGQHRLSVTLGPFKRRCNSQIQLTATLNHLTNYLINRVTVLTSPM